MAGSFKADIVPLFSAQDVNCMFAFGVLLNDFDYMSDPTGDDTYPDHANANHVLGRLSGAERPQMPKGGPYWTATSEGQKKLATLKAWMTISPEYQS